MNGIDVFSQMNGIDVFSPYSLSNTYSQQQAWSARFQYEEQCKHLKLQTAVDRLRSEIEAWCGGKLNSY